MSKRFQVFCRGNLVQRADTRQDAERLIEELSTEDAPADVWNIVDTEAARLAELQAELDDTEPAPKPDAD